MTSRNIRSRVGWLEKSRKPNDEILVVWRLPGADVSEAVADVDHVAGDRVICITGHCRLARLMSAPGVDASAVVRTAAPVRRKGVSPNGTPTFVLSSMRGADVRPDFNWNTKPAAMQSATWYECQNQDTSR